MITPVPSPPPCPPSRSLLQGWVTCRYGWLIEFFGSAVVAAQPWPDLRAWYRRCKGEPWHPIQLVLRVRRDGNDWRVELQGAHEGSRKRIRAQRSIRCRMENPPFIPRQVLTRRTVADSVVSHSLKETDPHGNLEFAAWWEKNMDANRKAAAKYIRQIPEEVLGTVAEFPEWHWDLLAFAALGKDAMKLIETNPGLAVALSSPREFRDISSAATPDAIREMLGKRQIEIAGWLGFPAVGRSVEIIRKLPRQECSVANLLKLRNHMYAAVRLHQVPCINTPLLRTLVKEGSRVRLLEDYLAELGTSGTAHSPSGDDCAILQDVQWMRRRLGDLGVIPVSSSVQLRRLHDSLLERFGRTDLKILNRPPLPPPPMYPQCPFLNIEPVTTEDEVLEEAKRLDGDLDGYIPSILKGQLYIYRACPPEDITFSVHLWRNSRWRLQEIKRRDGKQVGKETMEAIFDWLEMHNQSPEP